MIAKHTIAFERPHRHTGAPVHLLPAKPGPQEGGAMLPFDAEGLRPGLASARAILAAQHTLTKARTHAPALSILRQYGQGKSSLEELVLELYFGNLSMAKAEEIARLLWGQEAGAVLISGQVTKVRKQIRLDLAEEIVRPQVYVFLQAVGVRQKLADGAKDSLLMAAIGMAEDGLRELLGVMCVPAADEAWPALLADLKRRGLRGTELFVGENDPAAMAAVRACFPGARYQGCLQQMQREIQLKVPPRHMDLVAEGFAAMRSADTLARAQGEAALLIARLGEVEAFEPADLLKSCTGFLFNYHHYPRSHWARLCDIDFLKKLLRMVRERVRIIGPVIDDEALVLLAAARLRQAARTWKRRRFIAYKE